MADEIDFSFQNEVSEVGDAMRRMASPHGGSRLGPEWVTPMAIYLVSEQCTATHRAFSAVSGRYAEVFIGAAPGWAAAERPDAEAIERHLRQIEDVTGFTRPISVYHEVIDVNATLASQLG